ncbi:hypothetical protein BH11PSE11_BH11PSE11_17510 [soil metagenome]
MTAHLRTLPRSERPSAIAAMWLALICFLLLLPSLAHALEPLRLHKDMQTTTLFNAIEYLEDPAQSLQLDQVRGLPAGRFEPLTRKNYNKDFSASAYWLRLRLDNPGTEAVDWAVHHRMAFTDLVEYWLIAPGNASPEPADRAIGGDRTTMAERQTPYRYPAIRHVSQPGESIELYIRVSNRHPSSVLLLFDLNSARDFVRMIAFDQARLGVLYGMPIALAFMALIGWYFTRDRRQVLYALYAFAVLGSWLGLNGQLGQYVFSDMPDLSNSAQHVFFMLSILFSSMFSRDFLHTRQLLPWCDRFFQALIWASVTGICLRVAGVYAPVTQLSMLLMMLDIVTPLIGWLALTRGVSYARWYIVAQILYSTMIVAGITLANLTDYNFGGFIYAEFGFFGQLMLLSVAQYDRMRVREREKKLAEKIAHETLETQVAERTRDLEDARQKADRANSSKSEFLANMSHEIRTPINAIAGFTTLALRTDLNPRQSGYVVKIHTATQGLLRIINDLLDFSKIEAGHLDMEKIPFRLSEVMGSALIHVGPQAEQKDLKLIVDVAPDVPENLVGDPMRLGQILINLCGNAVKFTERGEVEMRVALKSMNGDSARLSFTVRDTGIGLSPEQAGKLFQAFTQADTSTTRKFGGTGLGLTISQRLVEMMNGRIWLESEEGIGTRFMFELELGVASQSASELDDSAAWKNGSQTLGNANLTVARDAPVSAPDAPAKPDLAQLLERFASSLAQVTDGLSSLGRFPVPTPAPDSSPVDPDGQTELQHELRPLLEQLRICLQFNDTRAEQLVAEMQALMKGGQPEWLQQAAADIMRLDYQAALACIPDPEVTVTFAATHPGTVITGSGSS